MRRLNYQEAIPESVADLLAVERKQQSATYREHVKFIRLLKSGLAQDQVTAGACIGVKRTQAQTLWRHYKKQGLGALTDRPTHRGFGKLTSVQIARLLQRLDSDDIYTQAQVQRYLLIETGVSYTQGGVAMLLSRLNVKLKTDRPTNVRKDESGAVAFKKTSTS